MNIKKLKQSRITYFFMLVLMVVSILSCSLLTDPATPTPEPTATKKPTNTPRPTSTTLPTETLIPTPAAVGEPVISNDLGIEITVVDAFDRDRIYPGGEYLYTPKSGYMIVDMGVKISNLNSGTVSIPWNQVYILEDNGDSWYPIWGKAEFVASSKNFDPFSIGISSTQLDGDTELKFENDAYLRIVYMVRDSNDQLIFGIGMSPPIKLTLRK